MLTLPGHHRASYVKEVHEYLSREEGTGGPHFTTGWWVTFLRKFRRRRGKAVCFINRFYFLCFVEFHGGLLLLFAREPFLKKLPDAFFFSRTRTDHECLGAPKWLRVNRALCYWCCAYLCGLSRALSDSSLLGSLIQRKETCLFIYCFGRADVF